MQQKQYFALGAFALAFSQAVHAAGQEALPEIVVTATRTAKVVSEAPATVTVVTSKEIANKNARRIDEALAGAPGVFINALGDGRPNTWQNQITLRGTPGYYRTGVLLDGVPINNAFSGGVNTSMVPLDDIKQIEVVPGPFSSLYGGAGMAGVINIITRTPVRREVSVAGEAGSNNFRSIDLGYRDKLSEAVGVSLSVGRKQSAGYADSYVVRNPVGAGGTVVTGWRQAATSTGTTTYIVGDKGNVAWDQDRAGARFFLELPSHGKLVLDASYLTHRTRDGSGTSYLSSGGVPFYSGKANINGLASTINITDFLATTTGEDLTRYSASYETQLSDFKLKANLSYQNNHYWYNTITTSATNVSGPGTLSDIPNNMVNGDVQVGTPVGERQYVLVGASVSDSNLRKKVYALASWRAVDNLGALGDWADGNARSYAIYAQDEIALSDNATLYAGVRHDRVSNHGVIFINKLLTNYNARTNSATSPKLSLVYKLGHGTVLKAALGKAFRSPNLSDMYSTFGTTTIYWSNPDLLPEKVTTAEAGIEHEFGTGTLLRATLYRSDFKDLIYTTTTGINRTKLNAGKAEARGIDLELRQKLESGLTAFANATFSDTRIIENAVRPTSVGKQIPLQAKKMGNIGLEGALQSWSGSVIGTYVGKRYSQDDNTDIVNNAYGSNDPYFVVNAKLAYHINKELSASVAANNLFGRNYYQGLNIAAGRSLYFGLDYRN